MTVAASGSTTGGCRGVYAPLKPPGGRHAVLTYNLYGTASKPYVDQEMDIRTFWIERTLPIQPNILCGLMIHGLTRCSVLAKNKVFQL